MANLSLNPMATTNALGSFGVQSDGYVRVLLWMTRLTALIWPRALWQQRKPNLCGAVCR